MRSNVERRALNEFHASYVFCIAIDFHIFVCFVIVSGTLPSRQFAGTHSITHRTDWFSVYIRMLYTTASCIIHIHLLSRHTICTKLEAYVFEMVMTSANVSLTLSLWLCANALNCIVDVGKRKCI